MKMLIIFWAGLGNTILLVPTLKVIRSLFAQGKIHMLIKEKIVPKVLEGSGLVDRYIVYNKSSNAISNLWERLKIIWKLGAKKYDRIITVSNSYNSAFLTSIVHAKLKIGYASGRWWDRAYDITVNMDESIHEVDGRLNLVKPLGMPAIIERIPEIQIGNEEKEFARKVVKRVNKENNDVIVGIHPGCSDALINKRWYPDRFAKVADILSGRYNASIILFGGPNEIKLTDKILGMMNKLAPLVLAGKTSIKETAAVIGECSLFISNDSGLMHVAAAMKTPVISILGPTSIKKNAPIGYEHLVVSKQYSCSPCQYHIADHECPMNYGCLTDISVNDVLHKVEGVIRQ